MLLGAARRIKVVNNCFDFYGLDDLMRRRRDIEQGKYDMSSSNPGLIIGPKGRYR